MVGFKTAISFFGGKLKAMDVNKKFDETIKSLIPVNVGRVKMQWNGKWQNQEFPVVSYFVKINEMLHLLRIIQKNPRQPDNCWKSEI